MLPEMEIFLSELLQKDLEAEERKLLQVTQPVDLPCQLPEDKWMVKPFFSGVKFSERTIHGICFNGSSCSRAIL